MLVLSRKENEAIRIGDDIEISVISIEGNRVRLGFSAPREVSIVRSELLCFGTDDFCCDHPMRPTVGPTVEFEFDVDGIVSNLNAS